MLTLLNPALAHKFRTAIAAKGNKKPTPWYANSSTMSSHRKSEQGKQLRTQALSGKAATWNKSFQHSPHWMSTFWLLTLLHLGYPSQSRKKVSCLICDAGHWPEPLLLRRLFSLIVALKGWRPRCTWWLTDLPSSKYHISVNLRAGHVSDCAKVKSFGATNKRMESILSNNILSNITYCRQNMTWAVVDWPTAVFRYIVHLTSFDSTYNLCRIFCSGWMMTFSEGMLSFKHPICQSKPGWHQFWARDSQVPSTTQPGVDTFKIFEAKWNTESAPSTVPWSSWRRGTMKASPSGLGGNQHESATVAEAFQNIGATESQKRFWRHLDASGTGFF